MPTSSSDIITTSTELAVLAAGRAPAWQVQPASGSDEPPDEPSDGIALQSAVRTLVHIATRENSAFRTARVTFPVVDLTATYTITIEGVDVSYDAGAGGATDLGDIIAGLITAFLGSGLAILEIPVNEGGLDTTLLIQGFVEQNWSIALSATGTAEMAAAVDPLTATMRLWWLADTRLGSTAPTQWVWSREETFIDRRGFIERFDSGGMLRLFVQLDEVHGHPFDGVDSGTHPVTQNAPVITIGPGLSET